MVMAVRRLAKPTGTQPMRAATSGRRVAPSALDQHRDDAGACVQAQPVVEDGEEEAEPAEDSEVHQAVERHHVDADRRDLADVDVQEESAPQ